MLRNLIPRCPQVEQADLAEVMLGLNTVTRGEHIRRLYKADQAYDCRDALAKVRARRYATWWLHVWLIPGGI